MEISKEEIILFIDALKKDSEYDFDDYSEKSFKRRVEKVLTDNNCDISKLISKINSDKSFLDKIVKDIL